MTANSRQIVYAGLAVLGLATTWYYNLQAFSEHGVLNLAAFVADGFANSAASSLTSDLLVAFLAFLVWLPGEAKRLQMRRWWAYLVLGVVVAFAFAFPLFLLMRERRLSSLGRANA